MTENTAQTEKVEFIQAGSLHMNTLDLVKKVEDRANEQAVSACKNVLSNFAKIEAKQACMRVQFLDWLSCKLLDYSKKVHEASVKINSPCIITVPVTKTNLTK